MRFKDFLSEGVSDKEIRAKITEWRTDFKGRGYAAFGKYTIDSGMVAFSSPTLGIRDNMIEDGKLAIPFISSYNVSVLARRQNVLRTFENFPKTIFHAPDNALGDSINFNFSQNGLTSLEHFPRDIDGTVDTSMLDQLSLSKAHKHIDRLTGGWRISSHYVGPVLGVLLIKGLRAISLGSDKLELNKIINSYLQGDIMDCQEELIQLGYKDYAKL